MEQRSFLLYSVWIFNEILRLDASNDSIRKQGNERWRVKVEQEYSLYEIAYGFYYTIVRSNCYGKMIHSIKYSIYKFEDIKLTSTLLKSDIPSDLM